MSTTHFTETPVTDGTFGSEYLSGVTAKPILVSTGESEPPVQSRAAVSMAKQVTDVLLAIAILLLVLPVLLVIAIAIKLDSKGPIVYAPRRIGRGGKLFRCFKFRTMVQDADGVLAHYLEKHPEYAAEWEANHKLKDDPRITRLGRLLRVTSLDELPQLFNVIRGDMSLVGPRPIVTAEIRRYGADFAYYAAVRPGLTGLWQVSGRNDTTYAERVKLDADYVIGWTFANDLRILMKTFVVVLFRTGAY